MEAYCIPLEDPIFDSLRDGYEEFNQWWRETCIPQHRKCWVVLDEGIAGIVVRKDEFAGRTDATIPAEKILKICTFKVRPEKRGIKLGELLLKQVFWYAQSNSYDLVYVTTFPTQQALIDLLEYYGFEKTHTNERGEIMYEKRFSQHKLVRVESVSLFDLARLNYPRFVTGPEVPALWRAYRRALSRSAVCGAEKHRPRRSFLKPWDWGTGQDGPESPPQKAQFRPRSGKSYDTRRAFVFLKQEGVQTTYLLSP